MLQSNQTGLHVACELGKDEITELLISRHAPIESKDEDGTTPLIAASRCGSLSCVQLMVDAGANINAHDEVKYEHCLIYSYRPIRGERCQVGGFPRGPPDNGHYRERPGNVYPRCRHYRFCYQSCMVQPE